MKTPKLTSGITGFYNEHNEFVCTGSKSGRSSSSPGPCPGAKFSLKKMRINSGGYDEGGVYWGLGAPLYWAYSEEGDGEETKECFIRAGNREDAKEKVERKFPGARFYR